MSHTPNQRPRPSPRPSPRNGSPRYRPATIAELADRARDDLWDPSKGVKFWLKTGENHRRAGKAYAEAGDLENAFVEYAKAATIVLEKLPSHRDYHTMLNEDQRHNLGLNGQDILDSLSDLKPTLVNRNERWAAQHPGDNYTQPSPGPSNAHQRDNSIRRSDSRREEEYYSRASIDDDQDIDRDRDRGRDRDRNRQVELARRDEQARYEYEERGRVEAMREDARRRAEDADRRAREEMERRHREDTEKRRRELARRDEEARRGPDPEARRRDEAVASAKRAAGTTPNNYYATPQPSPIPVSEAQQRQQEFDRQQAEMKKREEEILRARRNDITRRQEEAEANTRATRQNFAHTTQPTYRGNNPSGLAGFPEPQTGSDIPFVMPLESPTGNDDDYSTDRESVNESQAPWHRSRSQGDGTGRAPVRSLSYPPSVTTTSPAPVSGPIRYPTLMSQHQLKQGYAPSLQSMFINQGLSATSGTGPSSSLLFVPEGPPPNSLYPSAALPRPTSYTYGPPQPQHHSSYSASSPYGVPSPYTAYPPGPSRQAPVVPPTVPPGPPRQDESRISKPNPKARAEDPVPGELKNVSVPRDCLPKFLSIAAINTARNRETCGLLLGKDKGNKFAVTTLLVPKQHSTSDTCTMDEEELVMEFTEERSLITLGWIHTHPSQSCFMSSVDLHTHSGFQRMLPESFAVVCAPNSTPNFGIFRLTDPPGLTTILECNAKEAFHPHPDLPIYTDADKGHVQIRDLPLEIVDLRF